jgi:hypothetical protein
LPRQVERARTRVPGATFECGVLATIATANADDEVDGDWLGAPRSTRPPTGGCSRTPASLIEAKVIPIDEPGHGPVSFMWALGSIAAALPRRDDDRAS